MLTPKRKISLLTAFTVLMCLGWAGCQGFFVKPALTKMAVNPSTVSVLVNQTTPLTATGTFDDGSTADETGSSTWSSSDVAHATVNSSGVVTGVANTSSAVTITATKNGISGTASVSVGTQTLTVTSPSGTTFSLASLPVGGTIQLDATLGGTDVTSTTTFTSSNNAVITMSTVTPGQGSFGGSTGTVTITATNPSANGSGSIQITVNP